MSRGPNDSNFSLTSQHCRTATKHLRVCYRQDRHLPFANLHKDVDEGVEEPMWERHALALHLPVHVDSKAPLSAFEGSIQQGCICLHATQANIMNRKRSKYDIMYQRQAAESRIYA